MAILGHRLVQFALSVERIGETVVHLGDVRLERQRLLILGHRLVQFALLSKEIAEIGVRVGVIRLEIDGPGVMNSGLFRATKRAQGQSNVIVKSGNPLVQGDRLANRVYRLVVAAPLMGTVR